MHDDMTSVVERMTADVEAAFDLFGPDAAEPSLLAEQLGTSVGPAGALVDEGNCREWAARARRLIDALGDGGEEAIRHCADCAFDDPDSRMRGLAWSILAEIEDRPGMKEAVSAAVVDAYTRCVAQPSNPMEREGEAAGFVSLIGASVLGEAVRQNNKQMEREFIATHGGADAWLIESSPSAALTFFNHPDAGRRLAAIHVAARAGKSDLTACEAIAEKMIGDPEPQVRLTAIVTYGEIFEESRDPQCLRRLAALVSDEELSMYHRFAAYCALVQVWRAPLDMTSPLLRADDEKMERLREGAFDAGWPVEVDWALVERCAKWGM